MADDLKLTEDDVLAGDMEAINKRVDEIVEARIKKREEVPADKQKDIDDAKKAFAIFADEDETIRESAELLYSKGLKGLPAEATAEQYKQLAEGVSKRLARLKVQNQNPGVENEVPGPAPAEGGSAAAAHMQNQPPRTIEAAEALADKISQEFTFK